MYRTPTLAVLAPFALILALPAAAQSAAEQKMAATVEAETERHVALLETLVNQNSGSLNIDGVTKVGQMVRTELEPLGFKVEWIDMKETGRAGHLIATHTGNGKGKRLLLIGHLDTVFEPESPFQKFVRNGDRASGPGIGDDKGGIVVIVAALRAMQAAGTLKGADIKIVLTGDEERTGKPLEIARRDLIAAGKWADVALEYENLARDESGDKGTIARRSSASWTLTTSGKTGHSSGVFGAALGYGAAYELVRILDEFRRTLPEQNLTFNIGTMAAGTPATLAPNNYQVSASGKTNIVAEQAVARGDLRALTPEQEAKTRAAMQAIVAKSLPGTSAKIEFEESYPPMAPTAGNRALLVKLNAVNRDMKLPEMTEMDPAKRGAADSAFVAADVDTLAGLGVAGGGAHAEGEWVDLTSIPLQALRNAVFMTRLSKEKR
ncbi:M20/M25/M40 family metallo-hydrolase [Sphingomonas koreensis]|jgi:glutamate carboxypeptidase|uniref:M20/M25/M40 family metallo-hydrolase n=1 Tax=Sphingomonas koreensis TaxID=93064 RepID=A0A1L6JEH7_9SPHN|nr:M20/M25/M40 family metallo-hydrolase [Sphingomonas koreensis]APR54324.1 peptidase M20 [Sphingomonas koreensis]MDC7809346.1 M20/M25/M40 family metallo-hydrolase [Sphingomonas koreensis]RSU18465.1 M20/M25/M40 family metallo-hydrolase [Sphingomonas koreensis]RSU22484.1 M20/M25/M40 family metallo-hydrolase [Sphingomonas koreensis]RSU23908.1 M20/M25/M40 family metallo-hydrolase [Sphingomonas koreensis]